MTTITDEHLGAVLRVTTSAFLKIFGRLSTSLTNNIHRNNLVSTATIYVYSGKLEFLLVKDT